MADRGSPDPHRSDPLPGVQHVAGTEEELKGVLEEAATFAGDISHEIGPPDVFRRAGAESAPGTATDKLAAEIDRELNRIDDLLRTATSEVGDDATPGVSSPATQGVASQAARPDPIPDFMREFTEPEKPGPAATAAATSAPVPAAAASAPPSPAVPDFMAEFTSAAPPTAQPAPSRKPAQSPSGRKEPSPSAATSPSPAGATADLGLTLESEPNEKSPFGGVASVIPLLDWLNRPVRNLSSRAKQFMGLVAMGLTALAILVLILRSTA